MGSTYRICVCFTRRFRITEADPPPDVKEALKKYSDGGAHTTAEQFRRFLEEVQGEAGATIANAERIVEQVLHKRQHIAKFTRHTLTLDAFHHYLFFADLNPPIGSQFIGNYQETIGIKTGWGAGKGKLTFSFLIFSIK